MQISQLRKQMFVHTSDEVVIQISLRAKNEMNLIFFIYKFRILFLPKRIALTFPLCLPSGEIVRPPMSTYYATHSMPATIATAPTPSKACAVTRSRPTLAAATSSNRQTHPSLRFRSDSRPNVKYLNLSDAETHRRAHE